MKPTPLCQHLVARRFWDPLSGVYSFMIRPVLIGYEKLFTRRALEKRSYALVIALLRIQIWLARRRGRQRAVQLFQGSSVVYDLCAVVAALLTPFVRLERACRRQIDRETDPILRHE